MRTRAFRPEVPGCLEDRSLFSGVAGPSIAPVVFPNRQLHLVINNERLEFLLFSRDRDLEDLRARLRDVAVLIPFGRVDGLGVSINGIIDRMERDLAARVPNPVRSALKDVIAVTRGVVKARVQAGDVVVR